MSAPSIDEHQCCSDDCDRDSADIPACPDPCRRTTVQSFDLDAAFRRRFKLYDDVDDEEAEEQDCDCAVSSGYSEYSDDYTSVTASRTSTTTLPPELLDDRLATLSVSSGDSFFLDCDDDDDRCSISTLENMETGEDQNVTDTGTTTPPLLPPAATSGAVEDLEFNFLARSTTTTVCRSASLKSTYATTPPRSPHTKKVVRFADALGLDLESIRHILDVNDALPTSLCRSPSDFGYLDSPATFGEVRPRMRLMVRFSEPGSSVNFLRRVQERKVSLEEVSVDSERRSVSGVIRVANVAYHKQVSHRPHNIIYHTNCCFYTHIHHLLYPLPATEGDGVLSDAAIGP